MPIKGLTSEEARRLGLLYGPNTLLSGRRKTLFQSFLSQFGNILTFLLIGAAGVSFLIGEMLDGGLIMAIVLLNALFGVFQEKKAEEAIAALKKMTVKKVRVLRDGLEQELESSALVPGDIVFIEEGVKVPADGTVIESVNLELNEAALTGESMPVPKRVRDEISSGTIVAKGRGYMEVVSIGMKTKFGQIAHHLSLVDDSETPLQKKLKSLTRFIGIVGICAAVVVFLFSVVNGSGYFPAFLLAVSLAVAVVPEGLPAVMTITLSIGVKEMSRRKSIVRKLSAIEALGSVTLIATDKTGTLTENKMKVSEIYIDGRLHDLKNLPQKDNHAYRLLLTDGMVCSTASLVQVHDHGRFDVLGDPTEGALLLLGKDAGYEPAEFRREWQLLEEEPFDSVSKRMTVTVKKNDETLTLCKGSPESILSISHYVLKGKVGEELTEGERKKTEEQMERWAKRGLRVLAFSYREGKGAPDVFIGMVAIHDAPRPEVAEAVERARKAGIKIIMITGDNEKTAEAVGVATGIVEVGADILTGDQVESYSDEELLAMLPKVKIFARTSPFHKHRIVKLYQALGEVVAVTGDGVNDAVALKQADVGIAMGLVGTDVARETADMVITDDNFASIVNAVEEGRNIIKNLKMAIKYLLSCNIMEAMALIGGLVLGFNHIFFPLQLLYINLVTDGAPALALAFSPRNPHLMQQEPDSGDLVRQVDRQYIVLVGVLGTLIILTGFFFFLRRANDGIADAAAFSILTLIQSFVLIDLWLSHRSFRRFKHELINPAFIAAFAFPFATQYLIVSHPQIAAWFRISTVPPVTFVYFVFMAGLSFIGIKFIKTILHLR